MDITIEDVSTLALELWLANREITRLRQLLEAERAKSLPASGGGEQ